MLVPSAPDDRILLGDDHKVAFPVKWLIELSSSILPVHDHLDLRQILAELNHVAYMAWIVDVNAHKRPESSVVLHKRISDGTDHSRAPGAPFLSQRVLQEQNIRSSIIAAFAAHAMVSRDADHGTQLDESSHAGVERREELVRFGLSRGVLVLDVVRQGQIEQISPPLLEQFDTRVEHEEGQVPRVLAGRPAAEPRFDALDAVLGDCAPVRCLGRETDGPAAALQAVGQDAAQLVLGGDRGDPDAPGRHLRQDGRPAEHGVVLDHGLRARGAVEEEVARDAVHRGRLAGDDGYVVGVGEGRHAGFRGGVEAVVDKVGKVWEDAVGEASFEILGIEAVDTDYDGRLAGDGVGPPM